MSPSRSALSLPALNTRSLQRLALLAVGGLSLLAAILLARAQQEDAAAASPTAQLRHAWQQELSQPLTRPDLDAAAVRQRYGLRADDAQHSLSWSVDNARDLAESLDALAATGATLHGVNIRRENQRYHLTIRTQP